MSDHSPFNRIWLLVLWIGASILGWAIAPISAFDSTLKTYAALAMQMLGFLLCGVLMGAVIAIGQSSALRRYKHVDARGWLWATFIGYALYLPAGLALHTVLMFPVWGIDFLPLAQPGTVSFITLPQSVMYGGLVVGLAQWLALQSFAPRRDWVMAMLWIFGTWASIVVGWLLGSITYGVVAHPPDPDPAYWLLHHTLIGL